MKITFMGTGAAEGIPTINCHCEHCTRALNEQGKLVRQRNAILFSLPNYELLVEAPVLADNSHPSGCTEI